MKHTNNTQLEEILLHELDKLVNHLYPKVKQLNHSFNSTKPKDIFFKENCSIHQNLEIVQKFLQYHTIRIIISNLCANLTFLQDSRQEFANLFNNSDSPKQLITKFQSITLEPVLTCHPTEPFSNEALKHIDTLHSHLEKYYHDFDRDLVKGQLRILMTISLVPQIKSSVELEVLSNLAYFYKMYTILPFFKNEILKAGTSSLSANEFKLIKQHIPNLLKPRSWVGGDADGNAKVTAETMVHAIQIQSHAVLGWHQKELNKILSLPDLPLSVSKAIESFKLLLEQTSKSIKTLEQAYQYFIKLFDKFLKQHSNYIKSNSILATKLENFKLQIQTFKFYLAPIDARQNAKIYHEVYLQLSKALGIECSYQNLIKDTKLQNKILRLFERNFFHEHYPLIHQELKRIKAIAKFPNIFQNLIISNSESKEDILLPFALCKIFKVNPTIIPLFETNHALKQALQVIKQLFAISIYKKSLKGKVFKVMVGYSDSERESGIFILPSIAKVVCAIEQLLETKKIKYSIFHGNGLDLARGGSTIFAPEQTIQGNHKRYFFMTPNNSLLYFFRSIKAAIYNGHPNNLAQIKKFSAGSIAAFEKLYLHPQNHQDLEEYLQIASPFWLFVKPNNFSSRTTHRDEAEDFSPFKSWLKENYYPQGKILCGIRAISQVNTIESTFTNFHLWYGLYEFLFSLKGKENTKIFNSFIVKDLINKALIGMASADFTAAEAYFPEHVEMHFLNKIKKQYLNTEKLIASYKLSLPQAVDMELKQKIKFFLPLKAFMSFANRNIIYKNDQISPKAIKTVLSSKLDDKDYLHLLAKIFGAVYCGFTEYRSPPYGLLDFSFKLFLKGKKLNK